MRRSALLRIAAAVALLASVFAVARLAGLTPSAKRIEHWADGLGVAGPVLFAAAGVALNVVFVPIPVLAGAARWSPTSSRAAASGPCSTCA